MSRDVEFKVRLEVVLAVDGDNPSRCGLCAFRCIDGGDFSHCALFGGDTDRGRVPECVTLTNGKPCAPELEPADRHCERAIGAIPPR